jgi:hypothetical protein
MGAMLLASCSSAQSAPTTTTEPALPQGKCSATPDNPTLGLAAITDAFLVRAWTDPTSSDYTEFVRIGDDPFAAPPTQGGDLTVVETATVSIATCAVFVGTCCEPVSGITYYGGETTGEWQMLMGRLPAISPDGERLSVVAYEQLVITPVRSPEETAAVISIPTGETVNFLGAHWLNIEQIALLGATAFGIYMWVATVVDNTVNEPVLITNSVNWMSENLNEVEFVGVDENGNIAVRLPRTSGQVIEYRYPDSFEVRSSTPLATPVLSYRTTLDRSAMVTNAGVLSVWSGTSNPAQVGAGYVWAG